MRSNIHTRLDRLEEQVSPPPPVLSVEDEIEGVYNTWWSHAAGNTVGLFTDREINVLGALYVFWEAPEKKHAFPSGALVEWTDNGDGTLALHVDGEVQIDDLPEKMSAYVDRVDPIEQPGRERYLRDDPRRYSEHILGTYRISEMKRLPKYIPQGERS